MRTSLILVGLFFLAGCGTPSSEQTVPDNRVAGENTRDPDIGRDKDKPDGPPRLITPAPDMDLFAGRLLRLRELLLGLVQLATEDARQPGILRQAEQIVHTIGFAPMHQVLAAETTVARSTICTCGQCRRI